MPKNRIAKPPSAATFRSAALAYIEAGCKVLPLNGKAPVTEHGLHDATTDPAVVSRWWKDDAKRLPNLGIVPPPRAVFIDADLYKPGVSIDEYHLPKTVTAKTGGGGFHFLLLDAPVNLPGQLKPGVEIKANGRGYVVAWPSIHPKTGKQYQWVGGIEAFNPKEAAKWPPALTEAVAERFKAAALRNGQALEKGSLLPSQRAVLLSLISPEAYSDWVAVGMALRLDYGDDAFDEWHDWSKGSVDKYPGEAKCRQKWNSFNRKDGIGTGTLVYLAGGKVPKPDPADEFKARVESVEDEDDKRLRSVGLDQCEMKGSTQLVQRAIEYGAVVATTGEPGSGKSFFLVDGSLHIATGTAWFDRKTMQGPVLYVAAEASSSIRRRFALAYHHKFEMLGGEQPPIRIVTEAPLLGDPGRGKKDKSRILDAIKRLEDEHSQAVAATIYDTVSACMGNGAENMDGMQRLCGHLNDIANRTGSTQIINHHPNTSGADLRGHSSLRGTVSTILKVEIRQGVRVVSTPKMRDGEIGDMFAYTLEAHTIGHDNFGDEERSCIVRPTEIPEKHAKVDDDSKLAFVVKSVMEQLGPNGEELKFGVIAEAVGKRFQFDDALSADGKRKAMKRALAALEKAAQATAILSKRGYYRLITTPRVKTK